MKLFPLVAALLGITTTAWAATSTSLSGTWRQIYSNAYVQTTREVDWRCIKAYVIENETGVYIHKIARLHGGPATVVTPVFAVRVKDNKMTVHHTSVETPVKRDTLYDIHEFSNDTVIITGEDNPALYVWTRDGSRDEGGVDIPRLMAFVDKIGFKLNATDIVPTYDKNAC